MEQDSIIRINKLHPRIRKVAMDAYLHAVHFTPFGVHPYITEGLRTFETQAKYYAQGRTAPGDIITYAKPGQSYHQYGLAFDFVNWINGKAIWPKNPKADKNWMIVVDIFKSYGFEAGIDWAGKKNDPPHLEMRFGYNWSDLLALHNGGKVDGEGYVLI
jgi:peptidoglycan L-alanyl-D-glutamate endopeptidase CwlK